MAVFIGWRSDLTSRRPTVGAYWGGPNGEDRLHVEGDFWLGLRMLKRVRGLDIILKVAVM